MKNELVSILSDLIAIPSPYPPGTSVEICAYAARRLKKAGYKVETATRKKGVDNVVARMKGKAKGPTIAFNAHVDTVGVGERANWKSDPYKALARRTAGAMRSTVNVGMFHGGHNTNVVPSACTVEIDRRLLPDEKVKDAFAELKKIVDGAGEPKSLYTVEFLTGTNGFHAPE